ncbi:MAG: hypothetical protein AB9866_05000 [Syntrophobacteraceae bacterium]
MASSEIFSSFDFLWTQSRYPVGNLLRRARRKSSAPNFTAGREKTAACWVMTGSLPKPWGRSPTLDDVIERVCGKYGIENALKKPGKDRLLSEARALAAWLVLETGCSSLAELGKLTTEIYPLLVPRQSVFNFEHRTVQICLQ